MKTWYSHWWLVIRYSRSVIGQLSPFSNSHWSKQSTCSLIKIGFDRYGNDGTNFTPQSKSNQSPTFSSSGDSKSSRDGRPSSDRSNGQVQLSYWSLIGHPNSLIPFLIWTNPNQTKYQSSQQESHSVYAEPRYLSRRIFFWWFEELFHTPAAAINYIIAIAWWPIHGDHRT